MKTDTDPAIPVERDEPFRPRAALYIPHSDLLLAVPLLSLLATLIWVIFGNAPDAPAYPPLTVPSGSVSASQSPGGPQTP